MDAVKGTVSNGKVHLAASVDWPEGTEVYVLPISTPIEDNDTPPTAEEIANQLELMDQIQPLNLSSEEVAEWEAARRESREAEKANFEARAQRLRRIWE